MPCLLFFCFFCFFLSVREFRSTWKAHDCSLRLAGQVHFAAIWACSPATARQRPPRLGHTKACPLRCLRFLSVPSPPGFLCSAPVALGTRTRLGPPSGPRFQLAPPRAVAPSPVVVPAAARRGHMGTGLAGAASPPPLNRLPATTVAGTPASELF